MGCSATIEEVVVVVDMPVGFGVLLLCVPFYKNTVESDTLYLVTTDRPDQQGMAHVLSHQRSPAVVTFSQHKHKSLVSTALCWLCTFQRGAIDTV